MKCPMNMCYHGNSTYYHGNNTCQVPGLYTMSAGMLCREIKHVRGPTSQNIPTLFTSLTIASTTWDNNLVTWLQHGNNTVTTIQHGNIYHNSHVCQTKHIK